MCEYPAAFLLCDAPAAVFFFLPTHDSKSVTAGTGDAHCVLEMCHSARLHGGDLHRLCFTTIVKEEGEGGGTFIMRQHPKH